MKDLKQTTQEYIALDNQKAGGCSLGCVGIGCAGVVALMFMMCGGGFYGLMYSSLPLKAIEAGIEADGKVKIDGLKGNLTSGFTADEIRFQADNDNWSNLQDLKFKYSSNGMFSSDRIIVEEVSVNGGTIYADWDPEESEISIDPNFGEEFEEELEEINDEIEDEFGSSGLDQLKEVRVDLIRVANLKIINPETELEFTLDEIKFDGFHWEDGELVSFGELLVRSTQLQLDTVASVKFADEEYAQRFEGSIKTQMDHRLKTDVDFAVDFALIDGKFHVEANAMAGAIQVSQSDENNSLTFADFTPVEFLKVEENRIVPSKISFTANFPESMSDDPESVSDDGSFQMGKTVFEDLFVDSGEDKTTTIAGVADVDGTKVTARLLPHSKSPFWFVTLSSEDETDAKELWAQTVFGKSFNELDDERQLAIVESSKPRPKRKRVDTRRVDKRKQDSGDDESKNSDGDLEDVVDDAQDLIDEIESDLEDGSNVDQENEKAETPEEEEAPFPIGADDGQ